MARPRTGNKQKDILDAAIRLFMSGGISSSTMQQIAQEAGIAVGTLYLYYQNKDDVVAACADEFAREHLEEASGLVTTRSSASAALRRYLLSRFRKWKKVSDGTPQAVELAQAVIRIRPERIADFEKLFVASISALISKGIEDGEFKAQKPQQSAAVLAQSLSVFFPIPGKEPPKILTEKDFVDSIDWFLKVGLT
jgi:AcrR family transcriptional regulator